jgi:hypothetical protein
MTVFWDISPCGLVDITEVSENASIFMVEQVECMEKWYEHIERGGCCRGPEKTREVMRTVNKSERSCKGYSCFKMYVTPPQHGKHLSFFLPILPLKKAL